jgi:hypothetical protein
MSMKDKREVLLTALSELASYPPATQMSLIGEALAEILETVDRIETMMEDL